VNAKAQTALAPIPARDGGEGSRIPDMLELRGTYDLAVRSRGKRPVAGVGSVAVGEDEMLVQLSHPPATMTGTMTAERGLDVAGVTAHGDHPQSVAATGTAVVADGVLCIRLTVSGAADGDAEIVMERPLDADLSAAGGRFRFDFPCRAGEQHPTSIEIETPIDRDGTAAVISRDDRSGAGARLESASIDVAPSGRFALDATYVPPEGAWPRSACDPPFVLLIEGAWPAGATGARTTARYRLLAGFRFEIETDEVTIIRLE
jgi:hypothetical protein